jgi:hypothetical protein
LQDPALLDPAWQDPARQDPAAPHETWDWHLVGVLPEVLPEEPLPDGLPEQALPEDVERLLLMPSTGHPRRLYVSVQLTLDRDEAEGYYLNLTSPQPSLFVLLGQQDVASATAGRGHSGSPQAEAVTASYSEAARWMDGGMVVVRTALPEPMLAWIAEFAQYHFQVEGKRKRGGFRPSFLTRQEFGSVARDALKEARQEGGLEAGLEPDLRPTAAGMHAGGG